ncbi:MAG: 4-(cytidine 5'-diphospho)-2-C-methyl-D-erythritol kinase [Bacteroidales bacterium]|nr:4-(cytidine 5'-diphospho)-2-C-methyl-D-erythritol kinase [Bacteroidales bacterium]
MLFFPNAKINIGLNVIRRRDDGYHDIETLMYPIGMRDAMEFIENKDSNQHLFTYSGIQLPGDEDLCAGLIERLTGKVKIPPLEVHLHKNIPPGAGLGGGSADVVFFLKKLVDFFNLPLDFNKQFEIASETGSDCPFFLFNRPMIATGRGELLSEAKVNLKGCYLLLVMPGIHISTQQAFSAIKPNGRENLIANRYHLPVEEWKDNLVNQFEEALFPQYPVLQEIKNTLYSMGAVYASMTGSGSGIYGIFREVVKVPENFSEYITFREWMS